MTNWRNIVASCKFLVATLYNVNDTAQSQGFWYFPRLRSREIHKNTQNNLAEILSNTCLYNIFETYLNYWGYLLPVNLENISWNFVTSEKCKQCPKTTRHRLCCEQLGTSHDIKGFAIDSFLERTVAERANDDLFYKNVKNAGLISAKLINLWRNFPWK